MNSKQSQTLASLSNEEIARLLSGASPMKTYDLKDKGYRSLLLSDGPIGVRMEDANGDSLAGISKTLPSTCFPALSTLASSFDSSLLKEIGEAIGLEARHYGVDVLLAPAMNIMRNPLNGRNFEYFSEDPFLTGSLASSYVEGMQSVGTGSSLKHFAANNNETNRFVGDSSIDLRALHDIYLKGFEMAVKKAHPFAIMAAYNRVNGVFCSQNDYLLNDTLRKEWGFDGLVMTDWGGNVNRVEGIKNGCDLEMPGMSLHSVNLTMNGLHDGTLPASIAMESVKRIRILGERTKEGKGAPDYFFEHYSLALKGALEGAILLKNDGTLPLSKEADACVIGSLFASPRYQGSGSSMLNPALFVSHKMAFGDSNIHFEYSEGYDGSETKPNKKMEQRALSLAKKHETIIFYGGLSDFMESEGFDRSDMRLPANQLSILNNLILLHKKIIFVYFGGSSVELPFLDGINALLDMGLPGEAIGEATDKILFGYVSPSGRLTYTWPLSYSDVPFGEEFVKSKNELYKESIYVGYRYYSSANKKVRFPFGFGLSYSKFEYSNMKVSKRKDALEVSLKVTNVGNALSATVVQVYIGGVMKNFPMAKRELKGFSRISLNPKEGRVISIVIPLSDLNVYDVVSKRENLAKGLYKVEICEDSLTPIESKELFLGSEEIKTDYSESALKKMEDPSLLLGITNEDFSSMLHRNVSLDEHDSRPYDMETAIRDFKTPFGRFFKWVTSYVGLRQYKKGRRLKDPSKKERECKAGYFVYRLMGNNSLRSLSYSSSGSFKYTIAQGILLMVNGHIFKGLIAMCKKEK